MLANLTGWHMLILLAVVLLLFGATKLPALAKSMGQSARLFKREMKSMEDETNAAAVTSTTSDDVEVTSSTSAEAAPVPSRTIAD
mgnify:FL=1